MTERRLALIIASYEYQDPDLRQLVAPAQDAEALARVLEDPAIGGFEVQTLLNEPSHRVNQAIEAFSIDRKPDDLVLLYYSGHGIKDEDGRLYFATTDTRRKMLRTTAIPATLVNDVMRYSRSRRQVLLLDCCYSGAFARGMVAKAGTDISTKERFEGRGRVVLTASDAIQYAFEGDKVIGEGSRSVFTYHLVQGLETGKADLDDDGWVSLDELYDYVYDRVTDEAPQQTPGKWVFDMRGDIIVARNPHWTVKPAKLPSELQQAIESPFTGVREGAVSDLKRLLHSSDEALALAARQALTLLLDDDSRLVSAAAARALGAVTTPTTDKPSPSLSPPKAQERLRRLISLVPTWIWAVVGVAAVVLFIVLGSLAGWGARVELPPVSTEAPTVTSTPTQEPTLTLGPGLLQTRSIDDMVMVYVPSGTFQMGSVEGNSDEQPVHPVTLDAFWIDQTEVTNAQYALCVADGECEESAYADNSDYNGDDYPVVGVSWQDAVDYCTWAGVQLPTEAQWEYAARGPDGYIYPWGNDAPTCELAQFDECPEDTVPVGTVLDGASWCGAMDMAGNVWEWVADWYDSDYYSRSPSQNPTGPTEGDSKVLRGGSWYHSNSWARSAARRVYGPSGRSDVDGFRCGLSRTSSLPLATPTPTATPIPYDLGATQTRPADDMVMVYVPGGTFQMGSDDGASDEQPVHTVTLDAFWIDQTEVTNAQYALCVADGECEESAYADDTDYNGDDYPVAGVSWQNAVDYCAWAGAQLPTEAQWEYAAKGTQGYIYPWGDIFDGTRVNFCDSNCPFDWKANDYYDDGYERTAPVGSFPDGASWCDARDLAGNVWEWTADWYGDYSSRAQTNPTGPAEGAYKVLRGGSWLFEQWYIRASTRESDTPTNLYDGYVGFRCIMQTPGR